MSGTSTSQILVLLFPVTIVNKIKILKKYLQNLTVHKKLQYFSANGNLSISFEVKSSCLRKLKKFISSKNDLFKTNKG